MYVTSVSDKARLKEKQAEEARIQAEKEKNNPSIGMK